jgi:serine/threonine protein kinase
MKDVSNQSNMRRKGVPYSKSNDSNKSSTQTIRDTSAPKTLQPPDKNLGVVKKKSMERRVAVKESHKKPSLVDRDRGSAGTSDKKENVIKACVDRKQSMVPERKPSRKYLDKNSGQTKTEENKEKQDTNSKSTIQYGKKAEKKQGVEKNASLAKKSVQPRPIEKAGSSVSLVRKKFERKIESLEHAGEKVKEKKHTQPVPKVTISQNLFLKGDANAKKKDERDDDTNECDSRQDKGCVDSNLLDESSLVNSSHNQSECLPSDSSDNSYVESIHDLDSGDSDELVPVHDPDTSDIFSVPSPDQEVDSRHPSDLSKFSVTQPVIHPDSHVNGSESDSSPIQYQSPSRTEVPLSTPCPISMNSSNPTNAEPVTLLSRMQTIPNLNIDDVAPNEIDLCDRVPDDLDMCDRTTDEMDICDRLPDRLGPTQLEHELPESPAYRSPLLSDSEPEDQITQVSSRHHVLEAFVGGNEEPSLRNKLLSNLVNKRSESDGIVTLDRPRPEMPVRRCESIDNAMDLVNMERDVHPTVHFPQNIKTVTPATIMKGPEDYTAGLQETVYLRAHYFGNPEPRVAWYKGGRRLNHVDRIKIRTYPGESTLVIRDLRADDSGKYEIQIENEVGNDECSASLCVEGPPEPPGGRPYITTIDRDTLRLTLAWYGSTFDGGSMLTGYIVEMSSWLITTDSGQPEPTDWTIVTSKCHSTSYIVKNLDPDREYIFRVKAQNIHGPSAPGKVCEPVSFMKSDEDFDEHENNIESDDEEFDSPFEHRQVTLEEGSIFKDNFDIYEELGRGRFGVVFKVKDKDTREVFAAKFVRCRKQEEREKCKEEINIMNRLDHSRLLQLAAAYENPREVIMIMEFIGGGELFEKVVADDFTLTEHDCVLFMRQICMAIGYMHQKDIVHLDLKPENILCKSKKSHQIKIIDFGLTRKLKPGEDVRILFGTPEFVSPEVISYEPVSASSDMWSVGVVCYVLLSGLSPFMGDSDVETFSNITGLSYDFDDEAFEHISEDAKDFIHKMLVKDQRKRLKALECLKHPWLNQRESDKRTWKEINTDKLKSFLMRRRWQKAAHAIRALGRFTSLGFRQDSKDSASSIALSTQSADF